LCFEYELELAARYRFLPSKKSHNIIAQNCSQANFFVKSLPVAALQNLARFVGIKIIETIKMFNRDALQTEAEKCK